MTGVGMWEVQGIQCFAYWGLEALEEVAGAPFSMPDIIIVYSWDGKVCLR